MLVEIVGAGVLAMSAPACVWVARGGYDPIGWALFALAWGHTGCMIVLAYLRLEQRSWPEVPSIDERNRAARGATHLANAELGLVAVGVWALGLPVLLLVPYSFQLVVVFYEKLVPAVGWRPRRIGMRLLIIATIFTALFVLCWGSGPSGG